MKNIIYELKKILKINNTDLFIYQLKKDIQLKIIQICWDLNKLGFEIDIQNIVSDRLNNLENLLIELE